MEIDLLVFFVATLGVLIAGISKGGFGSGASFAAAPLLATVVDPALALGFLLPLLIVMDVTALKFYWGKWNRAEALRLCLGALPGIIIASLVYRHANPDVLRFLIGAVALVFVIYQIAGQKDLLPKMQKMLPPWVGTATGIVAGFTSFISHAGGPPVVVYLITRHLTKIEFQATTVAIFMVINLFKVVPYAALGFFQMDALWLTLAMAPVAFAGTWIGARANAVMSDKWFFIVTQVLLVGAGLKLIFDAVS